MRPTKLKLKLVSIGKGKYMWQVTWPKPFGPGRNRRYFSRQSEAEALHDRLKVELHNNGRAGVLTERERNLFYECCEALKPFGRTLRDATEFFVEHLKVTSKSCTAAELVSELLKAKASDGMSETHLRDIRIRLGKFAEEFEARMVATITAKDIDTWLRSLPVAPLTRNHYRAKVLLAFNFAVRNGYATVNPALGAAKAKVIGKAPGILTVQQTARLLESASRDMLPYIAIGAFAGLRRAELERLDWSEIGFESGLIEVKAQTSKTAMRRLVTLQPNLRAWLLPVRKHKGNVTPEYFDKPFTQARVAAGIDEWPHNALRHSFASYHLAHFKNAAATALETGHSVKILFSNYRELVKPVDAELYWKIVPCQET